MQKLRATDSSFTSRALLLDRMAVIRHPRLLPGCPSSNVHPNPTPRPPGPVRRARRAWPPGHPDLPSKHLAGLLLLIKALSLSRCWSRSRRRCRRVRSAEAAARTSGGENHCRWAHPKNLQGHHRLRTPSLPRADPGPPPSGFCQDLLPRGQLDVGGMGRHGHFIFQISENTTALFWISMAF